MRFTSHAPECRRGVGPTGRAPTAAARSIHCLMVSIEAARFAAWGPKILAAVDLTLMIRDLAASAAALICGSSRGTCPRTVRSDLDVVQPSVSARGRGAVGVSAPGPRDRPGALLACLHEPVAETSVVMPIGAAPQRESTRRPAHARTHRAARCAPAPGTRRAPAFQVEHRPSGHRPPPREPRLPMISIISDVRI